MCVCMCVCVFVCVRVSFIEAHLCGIANLYY